MDLVKQLLNVLFFKKSKHAFSIAEEIVNIKSNLLLMFLKLFASRERISPSFGT